MFIEHDINDERDTERQGVAVLPKDRGDANVSFDERRGIVVVNCLGRWSPAQVDGLFAQANRLIAAMRARFGRVRVLVERQLAVPQSEATIQRLKDWTGKAYAPGDRVAVVVDTSLSKLQLRSQIDLSTHKLFISESAAMTWLLAHD